MLKNEGNKEWQQRTRKQ